MQARTRYLATSFATIVVLILPSALFGQSASIAKVDSLMAEGQTQQARAMLAVWQKENAPTAQSAYLTARLATKAQDAEDAYLNVALNFSGSLYAAVSLLRLGQARIAAGDAKQGAVYLERLLSDYPKSTHRTTAQEWLARIQPTLASSSAAPAQTAQAPARAQTPARAPAQTPARAQTPAPAPAQAPAEQRTPAEQRFSVQVGAFREIAGARSVARQLRQAGFTDVRLVTTSSNTLIRVRVGKFESSAASSALAVKLKAAGFPAAPVSGLQSETPVRE